MFSEKIIIHKPETVRLTSIIVNFNKHEVTISQKDSANTKA